MSNLDDLEPCLDLGMLEESPAWKLSSRFLVRSKVGGRPSWLQLKDLPDSESLQCFNCRSPMAFLAQLYAPIETKPEAFHRTIFIFMCRKPQCHQADVLPFVVFRNQLGRKNEFYPYDPPTEVPTWRPELIAGTFSLLCRVCGCSGSKKCASCQKVTYCSKAHQASDWKQRHKSECSDSSFERNLQVEDIETNPNTLPVWEIVMHMDDLSSSSDESEAEDDTAKEANELRKYEELVKQGKAGSLNADEVETYCKEDEEKKDPTFQRFLKVTKREPKQVVRYSRGGNPLWVSSEGKPDSIPNCEFCSSPRIFEFQMMPQLLANLKFDETNEIDWGTLLVYTCLKSCDESPAYKKEFIFRQNIV